MNLDTDWEDFCDINTESSSSILHRDSEYNNIGRLDKGTAPKSNDLYISTQTIISYLDTEINLIEVFWKLPIIPYHQATEGIIKKQIKFNSVSKEEVATISKQKEKYEYVDEYIINHIDNSSGRIKFKDIRKISIGISKKDITSYRIKKKSAFYNCFVIIIRLLHNELYKEVHVKIFNTGKIEIPGIQNDDILNKVYLQLINILSPCIKDKLNISFIHSKTDLVLINSNFNCGYYIKRDVLNTIFKKKYNNFIRSNYDPCTYPGIQCEIYYNKYANCISEPLSISELKTTTNITKVSFMVFRTGSVLIVGKCNKDILNNIYKYLVVIFENEFDNICESNSSSMISGPEKKMRSSKKRHIITTVN